VIRSRTGGKNMSKSRYQDEYKASSCFWGTQPAKYIRYFVENLGLNLNGMMTLDVGAGEGKNAVYLASHGARVHAVDASAIALSRFSLQPGYIEAAYRITTEAKDARALEYSNNSFDIIVAYGFFHCLDSIDEIRSFIRKMKSWIKSSGYFIGSTFTSQLPIPDSQSYLSSEALLPLSELKVLFQDWTIIIYEDDIITEVHPTAKIPHQHSLSRIIAKKP